MKSAVYIGLIGGTIVGVLQFFSLMLALAGGPGGTLEIILYYSPHILYFMCIYMSIKIFTRNQPEPVPSFKGCLKAGGLTALIISIIMGISFFIGLTHIDVQDHVRQMIELGQANQVKAFLASTTRQVMMDRVPFWSIPNFLLGFVMTIFVTIIFRLRGKKAK